MIRPTRRTFLASSMGLAAAGPLAATAVGSQRGEPAHGPTQSDAEQQTVQNQPTIYTSVKFGMVQVDAPLREKFELLKVIGFDGVELDSPGGPNTGEAILASREVGLPIHGVVDSIHWRERLSDPDSEVRGRAIKGLQTAIGDAHAYGGSSVLLVPGRVTNDETENGDQVWERSIAGIRACLPMCAKLGIHILIENVWNGFLYKHDGSNDQTADQLAAYIDEINSPWVGAYFDIGNHQKYGSPAEWIRTLGRRIVKLDVKDWGVEAGWSKIGDGDVAWPDVRRALAEIGYNGWATAEVSGGGEQRLREIKARMDAALRG